MALTLCSNCRLPVNATAQRCPSCDASRAMTRVHLPTAAAAAILTTIALLARRWA